MEEPATCENKTFLNLNASPSRHVADVPVCIQIYNLKYINLCALSVWIYIIAFLLFNINIFLLIW